MRNFIFLLIISCTLLSSCREELKLKAVETEFRSDDQVTFGQDTTGEWGDLIIESIESGRIQAFNYDSKPLVADSIMNNREMSMGFSFGTQPETTYFLPREVIGFVSKNPPQDTIELSFMDWNSGLHKFYAKVLVKDVEDVLDRDLVFYKE